MSIRHLFAGVNSPQGFYSCFQSIIDQEKASKIIYIKGGSGTGKSTLMKKIASTFDGMGEVVEVFHCSSDHNSLDGVHIVSRNIALMDSTAPHIMEPKYPKVNGEIFNAADCLDHDKLAGKEKELFEYCTAKEAAYKRGHQYLKAASAVASAMDQIYEGACDTKKLQQAVDYVIEEYMKVPSKKGSGMVRPLFLRAITPDGPINYLGEFYQRNTVVAIKGTGNGRNVFTRLVDHAVRSGYDIEAFFSPLDPENNIEHIHIPELKLWICAYNECPYDDPSVETKSYDCTDWGRLKLYQPDLEHLRVCKKELIDGTVKAFSDAKQIHRTMENDIFIPAMDFDTLDQRTIKLMEHLNSVR